MDDTNEGVGRTPREDEQGAERVPGVPGEDEQGFGGEFWEGAQGTRQTPDEDEQPAVQELAPVDRMRARQLNRQASWGAHNWGWLLGLGIVALVLGIIVASHAFGTLGALTWLSGLLLLFLGVAQLLTVGRGGDRRAHLLGGLIAVIGGVVLLVWPGGTLMVVAVVAGITVLAWGVVRGISAVREEHATRRHDLAMSVLLVVLGIVMIVWPKGTVTIIGLLIGLAAIVWGVVIIVSAFRLRELGRHWEEQHSRSRAA